MKRLAGYSLIFTNKPLITEKRCVVGGEAAPCCRHRQPAEEAGRLNSRIRAEREMGFAARVGSGTPPHSGPWRNDRRRTVGVAWKLKKKVGIGGASPARRHCFGFGRAGSSDVSCRLSLSGQWPRNPHRTTRSVSVSCVRCGAVLCRRPVGVLRAVRPYDPVDYGGACCGAACGCDVPHFTVRARACRAPDPGLAAVRVGGSLELDEDLQLGRHGFTTGLHRTGVHPMHVETLQSSF